MILMINTCISFLELGKLDDKKHIYFLMPALEAFSRSNLELAMHLQNCFQPRRCPMIRRLKPDDLLMILLLTNNVWSVGQFKINWQKAALGLVFGKLELFSCKIGSKKNIARFAIGLTFCQKWTLKTQTINNMQLKKGRKQTFKICFTKCTEMQIS